MSDSSGTEPARASRLPAAARSGDAASRVSEVVPDFRSTDTLRALQDLVDVAEAVPSGVARSAGLSTSELHALRHLMLGSMGPVDLARLLGVTSAASSGVVDRLEARGHVTRRAHEADGRRTEVSITESGRTEVLRLMTPMFAGLAELDASLSQDEREVVLRYLEGAAAAMRTLL